MTAAKKTAATKTAATKTAATKTAATKTAAAKTPAKKTAAKKTASKTSSGPGFSDAERAAMKERAVEAKADRAGRKKSEDAEAVLAKIAEMQQPDRSLAERIHSIVTSVAPELAPRTWYGMPAYARDGRIVCFFQPAEKFGARYATFGFNDAATLDEGTMWPTSYALTELSDADAKKVEQLVRRAVGG